MHPSLRAAMLGYAILSTAAVASATVQLANFQALQISNAQCRAAYTSTIEGCQASDFEPKATARCTEACVAGLKKIGEVVKRACKDVDVGETSIIGVFQNDIGVKALCPQIAAPAPAVSSAPPPPPPPASSAKPPAQTSAQASSSRSEAPPPTTLVTSSPTEAAQSSSSSSSQGIVVDPSPTSIAVAPATSIAPPPASSTPSRPNAQLSNADSGGGSPFDVQVTTGASSQLRVIDLTLAAFVGTAVLFGVCA
jgi:hypothetical protein